MGFASSSLVPSAKKSTGVVSVCGSLKIELECFDWGSR